MKIKSKKWLLGTAFMLSPFLINAQQPAFDPGMDPPKSTKENVPYSMYGVGNWLQSNHTISRSMGGVGIAQREKGVINFQNPASVVFLKNITFDFALEGRTNNFLLNHQRSKGGVTSLSYLGLGIPFNDHVGMSLTFQPVTNMFYFAQEEHNTDQLGNHLITYRGEGGLNKAQLGLAGQWKGFALGMELGYLFGNFENAKTLQTRDGNTAFTNSAFIENKQIGGLHWGMGALYHQKLKNNYFLDIGLNAKIQQDYNTTHQNYTISSTVIGEMMMNDTITMNEGLEGTLSLPATYGLGFGYGKEDVWKVMLDGQYTDWSQFSFLNDRRGVADKGIGFRLGATFSPSKDRDKLNYFHLIDYRAGLYFNQDYLSLDDGQFQAYGGSVGLSLPVRRDYNYFAKIHMALDIGQRKSNIPTLGIDNFTKFTIGVSFNDIWFVRPKYD